MLDAEDEEALREEESSGTAEELVLGERRSWCGWAC